MFQQAGVPFFEGALRGTPGADTGCLIVEVHDHRKPSSEPGSSTSIYSVDGRRQRPTNTSLFYLREGGRYGRAPHRYGARMDGTDDAANPGPDGVEVYRLILRSSDECLWNDLKMLDAKAGGLWSDEEAMHVEAQILQATAPPLCLTPDPHVTRIANLMLSSTMPPSVYPRTPNAQPYQRDRATGHRLNSIELEHAENQDANRAQIMRMMKDGWKVPRSDAPPDASFVPSFSRLDILREWRKQRSDEARASAEGASLSPAPAAAATAPAVASAKVDPKRASAAKKKRAKGSDASETPLADPSAPPADPKNRAKPSKRRKKEEDTTPAPVDDKRTKGAGSSPDDPAAGAGQGVPLLFAMQRPGTATQSNQSPGSKAQAPTAAQLPGYGKFSH